jgi:hypothetical protein
VARFALSLALLASPLLAAPPKPTEAEAEAIAAITKLGGTAEVDKSLDEQARLSVTFEKPTDAAVLALVKLPTVGAVDFRDGSKVTEKGFAALKELPDLQKLFVGKGTVSGVEAEAIGSLRTLGVLVLAGCNLTDAEVAQFKKLKNLTTLDLMDTAASNKCVDTLLLLANLEQVNLAGTKVADDGVKQLLALPKLKLLQLNNTKVTAGAIDEMEEELKKDKKRVVKIQR